MFFFIELGGMVEGVVVDVAAGRFPIPSGVEALLVTSPTKTQNTLHITVQRNIFYVISFAR